MLTNEVSPRDSQDDKIPPKHFKINPKVKPFLKYLMQKIRKSKEVSIIHVLQEKGIRVCVASVRQNYVLK